MHRIPFRLGSTDKTGQRTPPGQRLPGSSGPADSGFRSSGGAGASLLWNRNLAVPFLVLLAALAVGLMFLLPGGFAKAQSADQFFTYEENGTGPVTTFTASDPEGASPGYWSITAIAVDLNGDNDTDDTVDIRTADIADQALFKIDQSGVLSFKKSPSFEPRGANNPYRVTVQASDGSEIQYFKAYVDVTDAEEEGKVTWTVAPSGSAVNTDISLRQFQPGALLTPSVTDPDAVTSTNVTGSIAPSLVASWKWYRGSDEISGETGATYEVVAADVGHTITVEAAYPDGPGAAKVVSFTSDNPVQAYSRTADNDAPVFAPSTVTRRVAEDSEAEDNVGGPVTATDANDDILTYSVPADNAYFTIDPATGQLMVKAGATFNYEGGTTSYTVEVTARDSSNETGTSTVTVQVVDVDEEPTFESGSTAEGVVQAQTEGSTDIDTNSGTTGVQAPVFVAKDPEGENVTLSLTGNDAGLFELAADTDTGNGANQKLAFKAEPDFEMPGDRNQDNVYEVTVRASDGTLTADRALIIKILDDGNEVKVTVAPETATVGVALTATVAPENGISVSGQIVDPEWQWESIDATTDLGNDNNGNPHTCATTQVTYVAISGATEATYTPVYADEGDCLRAKVTYTYQFAATTTSEYSSVTEVKASPTNLAPKFKEGTSTFRVVAETAAAYDDDNASTNDSTADDIGPRIEATDDNNDSISYTLGGAAKDLFRVRNDNNNEGLIEVDGELDHEKNSSHRVTLTADDGSGLRNSSSTITVTIYVTDADEAPVIKDRAYPTAKGSRTVSYPENGTGNVASFTADDPEDATPIVWSLTATEVSAADVTTEDIADRALFDLDQNGVLTWKSSPNYEGQSNSGDDNYRVVVQASDGSSTGTGYFEVTVAVTNVDESGKITWTTQPTGINNAIAGGLQQFQPGAALTATLTDPDGGVTGTEWKWYRSGTLITGEDTSSYTVKSADIGKTIRVTATYSDAITGPTENASLTSANPVQGAHQANTDPTFGSSATTRRIDENSKSGNVGGPVTATDAQDDKLTYAFTETEDNFDINPGTGQITVKSTASLNYESSTSDEVTVTAYDSSGRPTNPNIRVTVYVDDVDEKPDFGDVDTGNNTNITERSVNENVTGNGLVVATYTASDPEGKNTTLSLMGNDADLFKLADDTETGNNVSQVLSFKKSPDFEMPGDKNKNNLYEVTVRASDGTLTEDRMVVVKVTDISAENGKVKLSPEDSIMVGVELTATVVPEQDSVSASGQITDVNWQWQSIPATTSLGTDNNGNPHTCATTQVAYVPISGATEATYTPGKGDLDGCLRVQATYKYQFGTAVTSLSDGAKVLASGPNVAPKFKEGTSTFRVVAEGTKPNEATDDNNTQNINEATQGNIGSPVGTTDANGDTVTYTLGGADAALFKLDTATAQLSVKGALDHETDSSHTVTLTANDGSGASNNTAMITVTIYVTDEDEKPEIMVGGIAVSGPGSARFEENNSTDAVATYTAAGPNAATATWSLQGDDSSLFMLDGSGASRMLKFRTARDYEMPADANTDNDYEVTVKVVDGTYDDTQAVTVTVTDVDEDGTVTLSSTEPSVGTEVTATLTDPDGMVTMTDEGEGWQWQKSDTVGGEYDDIADATSDKYTPADTDSGSYIRAMVRYTDGEGSGKSATSTPYMVGDLTINGMDTVRVAENTTAVETYTAVGPNAASVVWTLEEGADKAYFDISGGVLTFITAPNYEMPTDANTDNVYEVTVKAADNGNSDTQDVTVTVTNAEEAGMVTLGAAPRVGAEVTAELSDPDGMVMMTGEGEGWQWQKSDTVGGEYADIADATSATYTPVANDKGKFLRATVTYTDGEGSGKSGMSPSVEVGDQNDLLDRFDSNDNGKIDKDEVIAAITSYFADPTDVSRQDVINLITQYFADSSGS